MRRILTVAVIVALGALGTFGLLQATKNEPDEIVPGSRSEIVLDVSTKPPLTERQGARSLWAVCLLRAHQYRLVGQHRNADDQTVYVVEPALGEHARRRVVGCLEDALIERVLGDVKEVRTRLPS
jgi:hypothetical protein